MCQTCYRAVCAERCPYREDTAPLVCEKCGEPIFSDGEYYTYEDRHICADCADELTVDDLLQICKLSTVGDLFCALGCRHHGSA